MKCLIYRLIKHVLPSIIGCQERLKEQWLLFETKTCLFLTGLFSRKSLWRHTIINTTSSVRMFCFINKMSILIYFHMWVGCVCEHKHLIYIYHITQLTIAIPSISQRIATSNPTFVLFGWNMSALNHGAPRSRNLNMNFNIYVKMILLKDTLNKI